MKIVITQRQLHLLQKNSYVEDVAVYSEDSTAPHSHMHSWIHIAPEDPPTFEYWHAWIPWFHEASKKAPAFHKAVYRRPGDIPTAGQPHWWQRCPSMDKTLELRNAEAFTKDMSQVVPHYHVVTGDQVLSSHDVLEDATRVALTLSKHRHVLVTHGGCVMWDSTASQETT